MMTPASIPIHTTLIVLKNSSMRSLLQKTGSQGTYLSRKVGIRGLCRFPLANSSLKFLGLRGVLKVPGSGKINASSSNRTRLRSTSTPTARRHDEISTRIIHRWPGDAIGNKLGPL